MRRPIEAQPDGIVEWFHFDELTGEATIERVQDVEPVLEANKRAQASGNGFSPSRELREIAEIPLASSSCGGRCWAWTSSTGTIGRRSSSCCGTPIGGICEPRRVRSEGAT